MIVWTNGCFDVIHAGHIALFRYAKSQGTRLVVGVDSDERVRKSKGPNRPINDLDDRIEVLSSIRYIDDVVSFSTDEELVDRIVTSGASLLVIGSDYEGKKIIGSEVIPVRLFPRIPEKSSTRSINALRF